MSHRQKEKEARRAERLAREESARRSDARRRVMFRAGYGVVGLIAVTLIALSVLLGDGTPATPDAPATPVVASDGSGFEVGSKAPDFTLIDAVAKKEVGLDSLAGGKTLLFFSEGVACQACMVQVADLEKSGVLRKAGIRLLSVSTDNADDLAQAAEEYGIDTPLLADPTTEMSAAYGMLGHGGMGHPNLDGHAFILLDAKGKVLWHRAYQEMYVEPEQLLSDIRARA